ncbi:hypothetical protein H4W33_007128 [Kibdelosporangium phytohabitans]|nr:hypothetical protein [Kibdelosporangium phytohabitans]
MAGSTWGPTEGDDNVPPCPRPRGCYCTWTWRDTRWVKGDDHTECLVHPDPKPDHDH